MSEPQVSLQGLLDGDSDPCDGAAAVEAIKVSLSSLSRTELRHDEAIRENARVALRRWAHRCFGKRPVTDIHIVRLG